MSSVTTVAASRSASLERSLLAPFVPSLRSANRLSLQSRAKSSSSKSMSTGAYHISVYQNGKQILVSLARWDLEPHPVLSDPHGPIVDQEPTGPYRVERVLNAFHDEDRQTQMSASVKTRTARAVMHAYSLSPGREFRQVTGIGRNPRIPTRSAS